MFEGLGLSGLQCKGVWEFRIRSFRACSGVTRPGFYRGFEGFRGCSFRRAYGPTLSPEPSPTTPKP